MRKDKGMKTEQPDQTKICAECAHCKKSTGLLPGEKCTRPNLPKNLVTGLPDSIWCSMERIQAGGCGPSGKFYEPKPEPCKKCEEKDGEILRLRNLNHIAESKLYSATMPYKRRYWWPW